MKNILKGYKQTELGILPKEWEVVRLSEICEIRKDKFNPSKNDNLPCVELEHISQNTGILLGYTNSSKQLSVKNYFSKGEILFGKLRPYLRKFWKATFDGVCSSEIWVFRGNKSSNDFLFYLIQSEHFIQKANLTTGTKMPRADWNKMKYERFPLPPLKEQEKIVEILSTADTQIQNLEKLIFLKEKYKKGLMQKLFSQTIRFKGFNDKWEVVELHKVLKERKTYQAKASNGLQHVSLTKNGIEPKSERYNRDFLVKDAYKEYKITKINDICYNPANLKFGVICKNNYGDGILSPIYVTFEVNKDFNVDFLAHLFTWHTFLCKIKKYEQGTVYERMSVSSEDFLKFKILLPPLKEQQKIAEVLSICDDELQNLKAKLELLKKQKQALMQKLLSGKVRVKI